MAKNTLRTYWQSMKSRCYNQKKDNYYLYGGRGIKVCNRWRDNYDNFYKDMIDEYKEMRDEHGYSTRISIDRIDNDGNYCPENCRWATPKTQANNKRHRGTLWIDWKGEKRNARLFCLTHKLNFKHFYISIREKGLDVHDAIDANPKSL